MGEPETLEGLLIRYGQMAAELEETADPERAKWLRGQLRELDAVLDRLVTRTQQEANARGELA